MAASLIKPNISLYVCVCVQIVEATLEGGLGTAVWEFVIMQLQLGFVFFTFSLGTRAHYFGRTIMHGGAKVHITHTHAYTHTYILVTMHAAEYGLT